MINGLAFRTFPRGLLLVFGSEAGSRPFVGSVPHTTRSLLFGVVWFRRAARRAAGAAARQRIAQTFWRGALCPASAALLSQCVRRL